MSGDQSRPRQPDSNHARLARPNVSPALPRRPVAPVVSDSLNQAFVLVSEEGSGGASASVSAPPSTLHSAFSTDSVLTGLHTPLSAMSSPSDHIPRSVFSHSDSPFPDYAASFEPYPFQHLQGDSRFSLSSGSPLPPCFVDSSSVAIDGVASHQTVTGPWTHLAATEGAPSLLPGTMNSNEPGMPSRHLRTPIHDRTYSSASGQKSLGDSGYGTRSIKSQAEVDSIMEDQTEMDQRDISTTAIPFSLANPSYTLSQPSTTTPRALNLAPSESGQSATHRPQQRRRDLECPECSYQAKTRSDLKKHSARHKREHKCHIAGCGQIAKGFATRNDLDRHLKAVHKINNRKSRSYKCFADGCGKAGKEWPRLDNFKQHLKKMHGEKHVKHLVQLSNEWYEQQPQQGQADDTVSLTASIPSRSSGSLIPGHEQISAHENNYSDPSTLFNSNNSNMHQTIQMARSLSHSGQVLDRDLAQPLGQAHPLSQQHQRLPIPTTANARNLQQQRGLPILNTNIISSPAASVQRAWSQADCSQYQDMSQLPPEFTNQRVNFLFSPRSPRRSVDAATATMRMNSAFGYGQAARPKKPYTIAVPDLDPNRMTDFTSPQGAAYVPADLGGSQEDFLGFVGSITNPVTTDNGSGSSPHQGYQVNIIQAETNSPKSGLEKAMEEEIRSFLERYRSSGANQQRSDEEILNRFRLSLHTSDVMTSYAASSVGPASRTTDAEPPGGVRRPLAKAAHFPCSFQGCTKVKQRQSDLNKHMKRHWKPYGCVYDGCTKTFGSKNDWKRHEQTQHEQQECWLCDTCFKVFFHEPSNYIQHMKKVHSVSRPEEHAKRHRIARNYQGRFWCGFCKQIIVHQKTDVEAITYRFDHIADHFMKEHKPSKDWIELGGDGKTKEELSEERKQIEGITEEDDDALDTSQASSETTQSSASQNSDFSPVHQTFSPHPVSPSSGHQGMSKMDYMHDTTGVPRTRDLPTATRSQAQGQDHQNSDSGSQRRHHQRREVRATLVICCQCGLSNAYSLSNRCMDPECHQEFCDNCILDAPKGAT